MRIGKLLGLALATVLSSTAARAAEPTFVVYHQGRLLKGDGTPATTVDKIKIGIYDSEIADQPVWFEEYPVTMSAEGLYAVAMGDPRGLRKPLTAADVDGERFIGIIVDGTELKPRVRLGATPYALLASDARKLGGVAAADYLKKEEFDTFKTAITGGGSGGLTVPWGSIRDIPEDFGAGLRQVSVTGGALSGDGTSGSPVRVVEGGVATTHLKNGAVTKEKLAADAVTADVFPAGSISPSKLTNCSEGQILKFQSGSWQCGSDVGGGATLPFDVLAPLEQVAGSGGSSAKLQVRDGGISTVKIANDAIDASKLGTDPGSLDKITGGALSATVGGAVGVGITSPTARLEVGEFASTGIDGTGAASYVTGSPLNVTISGGSFTAQVRAGDSIQLGGLGWRTITAVTSATALTIDAAYGSAYGGTWTYRRATLRVGQILQTATGAVGVGGVPTIGKLDVAGDLNVSGTVKVNGVSAVVPAGAVMHFAIANCPAGWVKANGQTLNKADYPALAAAFGVSAATFTVPDLRGEFLRSLDDGRNVDGGRGLNSAQAQDFKSFSVAGFTNGGYVHSDVLIPKSGYNTTYPFGGKWEAPGNLLRFAWDGSEVRPRNVALLACIKG